jgi:hypothetical protein
MSLKRGSGATASESGFVWVGWLRTPVGQKLARGR